MTFYCLGRCFHKIEEFGHMGVLIFSGGGGGGGLAGGQKFLGFVRGGVGRGRQRPQKVLKNIQSPDKTPKKFPSLC